MNGESYCGFLKPDGQRCRARPLVGEAVCFFHSRNKAQARRQAQQRGGRNRRGVLPPDTPELTFATNKDVVAAMADTYIQVRRGELDYRIGNCLVVIAKHLLKVIQAIELERLAQEIERLKAIAAERGTRGLYGVGAQSGPAAVSSSAECSAEGFSDNGQTVDGFGEFSDEGEGGSGSDHDVYSENEEFSVDGDGCLPFFPDTA